MSLSNAKLKNEEIYIKSIDKQIKDLKIQFDNSVVNSNVKKVIPYGRQNISDEDIKSVVDVLKSDYLTQGPEILNFEKAIANYTNSKFGVAVNSATSALHISCMALGLSKDDILWTSPITFVASANCALYCGAKVDFVDIDSKTYNMSIKALSEKLEIAKKENKLPKIVIPVHLSGQSCEMHEIHELSKQYGFKIIEDASHTIGGKYKNEPVGNCKYSDITVFSFHPVKIITSGEGGMCTTNSPELANLLCRFRSHGITRHENEMTKKSDGPWYYQQLDLGYNYRMTDVQAALGLSQLKRLDDFIIKRHQIVKKYNLAFEAKPIITPFQDSNNYSSFHLYIIRIKNAGMGLTRLDLFKKLREAGILVNIHYIPIYKQPFYQKIGYDCTENILFIKEDKIETNPNFTNITTKSTNNFSKQRAIRFMKKSFGKKYSQNKIKAILRFTDRTFQFLIKSFMYKIYSKNGNKDITYKILKSIDQKIKSDKTNSSFDSMFFITGVRDDLYLRPVIPVIEQLKLNKKSFNVVTSDISTGLVL
ncbi:MAG: UDP-4-amino-4,6-dideoxy-N-acetyl-beta-L-altrosamine transaminase, partial [Flavobacteriaceae bacterium]|nr:UDP-4-amino-4,6-dideoxy-N-acetyl-beta-L-altrosamine transaminase [Flavobacteriaceae bacterium]